MKNFFLASLLLALYSVSYSEELKGTIFLETNYLHLRNHKRTANPNIIFPWVNILKNGEKLFNTNYYEENNNIIVNNSSTGLLAQGKNTQIINNGNIILNKAGVGMNVIKNANMINSSTGSINLNNNNEIGMLSSLSTIGTNKGSISLTGGDNFSQAGMASKGGTSINEGKITINSNSSYAMFGDSSLKNKTTLINKNQIDINNSNFGEGIESTGNLSFGINSGTISLKNSIEARGMVSAKGAESTNDGTINIINSKNSFGMNIGDGDSIHNKQTLLTNSKIISIDSNSVGSIGMRVFKENNYKMNKGIAENKGNIDVCGKDNIGMFSSGENTTVTNNNTITISENHNIGIKSNFKNSNGTNNGTITFRDNSQNCFGMVTFGGGTIKNYGNIILTNTLSGSNVGMQSVDGTAINYNSISLNDENQTGMNSTGTGIAENKGKIFINNKKGKSFGMAVKKGSTIINSNQIELNSIGYAMSNESKSDSNVTIINKGKILLKNENNELSYGIYINQNSKIIDEGQIDVIGKNNVGLHAATNSTIKGTLKNNISLKGKFNIGFLLDGATLSNDGDIHINGDGNIGIFVNNGSAKNTGNIYINGTENGGICAMGTSKVYNTGNIYITGKNNKGIDIKKGSSLKNTGKIIISGKTYEGSSTTVQDPQANIAIVNDGNILNEGDIITSDKFDTNQMGIGNFVMDKNSTLKAKEISGNIILSNKITTGSLKNTYSTNQMFLTKNMNANLVSNSILFNTKLQYYKTYSDAFLVRKNFNEIVSDHNLGDYLENNYIVDSTPAKIAFYDRFKLASSSNEINTLVDDTFGKTVFLTLEKQTFEMLKLNNNTLISNVSKKSLNKNFQYIIGGTYNKIDSDSSDNIQGYVSSLKNAWIGGEKRINNFSKFGLILSIGDYISNLTNNSHRTDRMLQGTFFVNYNNNNLDLRSFVTIGKTKTNLDRISKSYSQKLNSNFDNKYFILYNEISRTFNLKNNTYIIPKVSLTLYRLNQGKIKEKNGTYPLTINSIKNTIFEPGVGMVLGKNILLQNSYILKPELEFNYFYKAGDLKNSLNGKIKSISNDSFILKGHRFKRNSGNGKFKISLEKGNWSTYVSYNLLFENKVNSIGTIGINYKFN